MCKRVDVSEVTEASAVYKGQLLEVRWKGKVNLYRKRLWLKFSIFSDNFYLADSP